MMSGVHQDTTFIALTFVLILVVIIMSSDAPILALIIIGLLIGFAVRSGGGIPMAFCSCSPPARLQDHPVPRGCPGVGHSRAGRYDRAPSDRAPRYLGAFNKAHNNDDGRDDGRTYDSSSDDDDRDGDRDGGRDGKRACKRAYDNNNDELDGDERMNYQSRSRNDPIRVTAGTMNRRQDMDKYLREEVEEEEGRVWWGRHED